MSDPRRKTPFNIRDSNTDESIDHLPILEEDEEDYEESGDSCSQEVVLRSRRVDPTPPSTNYNVSSTKELPSDQTSMSGGRHHPPVPPPPLFVSPPSSPPMTTSLDLRTTTTTSSSSPVGTATAEPINNRNDPSTDSPIRPSHPSLLQPAPFYSPQLVSSSASSSAASSAARDFARFKRSRSLFTRPTTSEGAAVETTTAVSSQGGWSSRKGSTSTPITANQGNQAGLFGSKNTISSWVGTTPAGSNSSSGGGRFGSTISKKSVLIRNSLARRSTATFSRFSSRPSPPGSGNQYTNPLDGDDFLGMEGLMGGIDGLMTTGGGDGISGDRSAGGQQPPLHRNRRVYRGYSVGDWALISATSPYLLNSAGTGTAGSTMGGDTSLNPTMGSTGPVVTASGGGTGSTKSSTLSSSPSSIAGLAPLLATQPPPVGTPTLVNRFGYPRGEGTTTEEQRGPYLYVLGRVSQLHYEENAVFYTVTRQDNNAFVRGDAVMMEPILSPEGVEAARQAAAFANGTNTDFEDDDGLKENGNVPEEKYYVLHFLRDCCMFLLVPFTKIYDIFVFVIGGRLYKLGKVIFTGVRYQANLFLNGLRPYECSARVTTVNLIVLCTMWYMFIDQMRLAFFPSTADQTLAVINFVIWTILTLELLLEVFIRPDGYYSTIRSDKAFTPTTVRFISGLHLFVESISLAFFTPEFFCLFDSTMTCGGRPRFSFLNATILAIAGTDRIRALAGRAFYACIRFRVFGLVRHWRNMWINTSFLKRTPQRLLRYVNDKKSVNTLDKSERRASYDYVDGQFESTNSHGAYPSAKVSKLERKQRDAAVINASNIGTALMATNSYRALTMLCFLLGIFPMISLIDFNGVVNSMGQDMVDLLQGTNLQVYEENTTSCQYLVDSVVAWVNSFSLQDMSCITTPTDVFLLTVAIQPSRCVSDFENVTVGGMVFSESDCPHFGDDGTISGPCILGALQSIYQDQSLESAAQTLEIRSGNVLTEVAGPTTNLFTSYDNTTKDAVFGVSASYNFTYSTESSALFSVLLQLCLVLTVLVGLVVLRHDAEHLVLRPLRSMLKIVARYAKNPLSQATSSGKDNTSVLSDSESVLTIDDDASEGDGFGTYETEQLITAVSKITDLLRKCWGVAGADIISTNLASREGELAEVFNPTVPGKSVYALFAFAAINGFDHALKCLGGDVMILINDVAAVLHGEVFRWGFGDSGQCNKNLGAAFLMVFRIGLVKEVVEKLEEATKVVFSTSDVKKVSVKKRSREKLPAYHRKGSSSMDSSAGFERHERHRVPPHTFSGLKSNVTARKHEAMADAMQLSLQSLPGISTFTDRAVIGMLKSFAGIHRDNRLRAWSRDFRLSAGVGAWSVNMIFGMDAGWAVEGAVGSEYKIDATYLSPHVNMASRMMSACKHYGVTILLSEAVQELMSDQAKSKLRNLDRVTVKGSTQVQNLYTYDARHKGADFFLYSRSDEQANLEAERYQPNMWYDDQDLKAMRHHVTEDFEQEFLSGLKDYYDGNWPAAIEKLEGANEIMVDAALEEGYLHDEMDDSPDRKELYRTETADGPCKYLLNFMKSKGGKAPDGWAGWHPLLSK